MSDIGILGQLRTIARTLFHKHSLPRWIVFIFDSTLVFGTFLFAYLLRFNFEPVAINFIDAFQHALVVLFVYVVFELLFRSFSGLIRHTTIRDVFIVVLTTTASLVVLVGMTILGRILDRDGVYTIPISILLIHYVELTAILMISRILVKMFYEMVSSVPVARKRVLIFGAGAMGVIVNRVITSDYSRQYSIVGFLDNDRKLQRKEIDGIPVIDPRKLQKKFLENLGVKTLIFAIRDIPLSEKQDILKNAVELGLEVLEIPPVENWLNGQFHVHQLKKIKLEDLLRREPIQMNMDAIAAGLEGKTILVTGAAGSIGSEIVRQLMHFHAGRMVLVDNAETPMYQLDKELQTMRTITPVHHCLADVTDSVRMDYIFKMYKPDVVFHAAAYKHVPLLEENPKEAVRVNVGSTLLLTKLCRDFNIEKFVLVSTDKAVNPTNVMGASKRMCELILQARSMEKGNKVQFVVTRFGNVLGSNGSVIPLFEKQISEGGPVTVTHPDITRYFMTIPEACQLVLEAGFMGTGGEIFIFDMGQPVKISELAEQMIRLSGYVPGKDIKIKFVGLRPGEKLYEELFTSKEKNISTKNPKLQVAVMSSVDYDQLMSRIHTFYHTYYNLSVGSVKEAMKEIVPEFTPANMNYMNGSKQSSVELEVFPD